MQALWDGDFYRNEIPYSIDEWPDRDFNPTWGLPERTISLLRRRIRRDEDEDEDDRKRKNKKGKRKKR